MFYANSTRAMNVLFDLVRFPGWRPKTTLLSLFLIAVVAIGCGKQNASAPPAVPPETPVAVTPAVPTQTQTAPTPIAIQQPQTTPNSGAPTTLQSLNRAMVGWMRTNHRHPQNFEDFASTATIQIPAPPSGKKYTLNGRGFIVLVDISTP
jgi:hypothetical protein